MRVLETMGEYHFQTIFDRLVAVIYDCTHLKTTKSSTHLLTIK